MITWPAAAPVIKALLERLAITTPTRNTKGALKGRWSGKRTGFLQPVHAKDLILKIRSEDTTDDDERRLETVDTARREILVGQRRIIIEVRVECERHMEETGEWAWTTVGLIRTRLERQSSVDTLRAINMAVIDVGPAVDISYTRDGREVNGAMFELTLIGAFVDVNTDDSVDVFDRALVTSHLQRPDGTELPIPPNYTDTPMGKP